MLRFLTILLIVNVIFVVPVLSQNGYTLTISGNTSVDLGITYTYNPVWRYNGSVTTPPNGGTFTWTVFNGTAHSSGSTYAAVVWKGSGYIEYDYSANGTNYYAILPVSISSCANAPSVSFSLASSTCPPRQLSYTGTPPNGITWYWQTSPSGTSMTNSTNTYYVTSAGTYYLRAYNNSLSCWSSNSASYNVSSIGSTPAAPSTPIVISTDPCGSKALSHGTVTGNVTWYWQGTNPNGTNTIYTGTYLAFNTGTYYLRARDNSTGCWSSNSSSIYVTIDNGPPTPPAPTVSSNVCGPKTLTKAQSPPSGVNWYWQGTTHDGTDYTSAAATAAIYTAIASGTYYLRPRNGTGCWGNPVSVQVTVNPSPAAPPVPSISTNACYAKTLSKNGAAPSGITWYWQGINAGGTDYTSATATAASYSIATHGTATHYIRARNNTTGCWSVPTGVSVTVNNPAPPNANNFQYCEFQSMPLTTAGYSTSLKWYTSTDQFITQTVTYTPSNLNIGNYTYKVKNVNGSCESTASANVTLIVKSNCDELINWVENIGFTLDAVGNSVPFSASRAYIDASGNVIQTQFKSHTANQVLAAENIFDSQGNLALTTLPAPINNTSFSYRYRFTTNNSNQKYKASDFDLPSSTGAPGEVNNPKAVGNNGLGSLGWYYSTANTSEPKTPVTSFPYARSWSEVSPDPKISKSAGPGDQHQMGSGHEITSERQKIAAGELSHYLSLRPHFITTPDIYGSVASIGYKYITTDPNGKKSVAFVDAQGLTLATATLEGSTYSNWSYSYYDDLGKLKATVAPNGVNTASSSYPTYVTLYKYDHLDRLIETTSPDEGTTQYVYSIDGQIRFSQNQVQRTASPKRFSYTNYDELGRLVESGEYTMSGTGYYIFEPHGTIPATRSVLTIVNNKIKDLNNVTTSTYTGVSRKLDATRCQYFTFIYYDWKSTDLPAGDALHSEQTYTYGQISKTENSLAKTWYSYDEFGQLIWTKQNTADLGNKTIDYNYDFLGNVTEVAYQKNQLDAFYHHYTYDLDQRLTEVRTSKDGTTKTLHAKYYYYLHGPLKRVELAGNKQGIDYTYTIDGSLKSINHADATKDPGLDGISGPNASFGKDLFGMTMHYHDNDYSGASYNAGSLSLNSTTYPNQYNGILRATTYNSPADINRKRIYAYQYDPVNQLQNAQWGTFSGTGTYSAVFTEEQRENIPLYDKNGNIQSLIRKGKTGNTTADYTYTYTAGTNKLASVNHNGTAFLTYAYNGIGQMIQQTEGSKVLKLEYEPYGHLRFVKNASDQFVQALAYDEHGGISQKTGYLNGTANKRTYYVRDVSGNVMAVYEKPMPTGTASQIELPVYGSGRIGIYKPLVNTYFYELGDHLGNVRAVIGQPQSQSHTATMETEVSEEPPFKNVVNSKATYPNANHTPSGNEAARLNNVKPVGPTINFAVSPGDRIDINVWAYYEGTTSGDPLDNNFLLNAIATAFGGVPGGPGEAGQLYTRVHNGFTGTFGSANGPDLPAAFLQYVVYDKNYNRLYWGSRGVTSSGNMAKEQLVQPTITVDEQGYIYICVLNRSDDANPVYFDDLQVTITPSSVVAGADYYPFGMAQDAKEITDEPYRYGYQGQFSEENETTGWNEFELRMYDARIGRWLSPDPFGEFHSPYLAMGNNPMSLADPDGGSTGPVLKGVGAFKYASAISAIADNAFAFTLAREGFVVLKEVIKWAPGPLSSWFQDLGPRLLQGAINTGSDLKRVFVNSEGFANAAANTITMGAWPRIDPSTRSNPAAFSSMQEAGDVFGAVAPVIMSGGAAPSPGMAFSTPSGGQMPITRPVTPTTQATDVHGTVNAKAKPRSYEEPIGKRDFSPRRKQAYEKAKRAGDGGEPKLDPDSGRGPHYHPTRNGKQFNHDHYYFPKNQY